jgi:diguanylate cyclase
MGGEEFAIILPNTSEENAYAVCDRLRERIGRKLVDLGHTEISVTISSGIAALGSEDSAPGLIDRADKALYIAKRNGRDQVKLAA